ncbi:hypothetical protein [Desertibacillus haloalkaliphilus]|uniref:hypothetical protein n=1 Tax=Desertibacillus haloalkaliphilus TaxID=1328930 RepID=UPI001C271E03|nr:hypothetical protein [Desertibacillus haloalkaliphilus]MBU8908266.1 hypothetical protein [Desertibacillus haloalkaliphilus]
MNPGIRLHKATFKMDGFRFFVQHYKRLKQCDLPSSAWTVFLTMLSEADSRGILREYSLSEWSSVLGVSYHTLYSGLKWLERCHFVEEIIINDMPYYRICEYEELNSSETKFNYFRVPRAILDSNVFARFVPSNNVRGIIFMLSLLDRFRVMVSRNKNKDQNVLRYTMGTLKEKLYKREAKAVREMIDVLQPIFHIEEVGKEVRGNQVRVAKYDFTLRTEYLIDVEDFSVRQMMAKYGESLTQFLDAIKVPHKKKDTRDVLVAFRQEVIRKVAFLNEKKSSRIIRDVFIDSLQNIEKQYKEVPTFKIKSIGAYFRTTMRDRIKTIFKTSTTREERINAYVDEYNQTKNQPDLSLYELDQYKPF